MPEAENKLSHSPAVGNIIMSRRDYHLGESFRDNLDYINGSSFLHYYFYLLIVIIYHQSNWQHLWQKSSNDKETFIPFFIKLFSRTPGSGGRRYVISGNADFQSAVPQISQLLDNLQSTKQHLNQLWSVKKMRLEQCFQLRIFEEDVEKVSNLSFSCV